MDAPNDVEVLDNKHQEQNKDYVVNTIDDIFTAIGLGRWHILPILVSFLYLTASPAQLLSSVFTNMPLDYKCANITENTDTLFDLCEVLEQKESNRSCSKIEFNHSIFKSTFTSEFELICDKSWISNAFQVSLTIGLSIGSLMGGIGDKWGRVKVIRVGALGCLAGVLLVGFGPNAYLIILGRLITGLFCNILNISALTLALENTPTKNRSKICLFIMTGYSISTFLISIISYFLRYWRILHLTISCFIYLIVILSVFLDKSPRWLFQNGQFEEGITLFEKIIQIHKLNKEEISFSFFLKKVKEQNELKKQCLNNEINTCIKLKQNINVFFKNQGMVSISLTTPIIWFITGIVYFGIPLNANNFTDNPFVYMALLGLVEIISLLFGGIAIEKFGNIQTCSVLFTVAGSCLCIISTVSEKIWGIKWILVLIAMMSIAVCYTLCYIISTELYPTQVRASGLGICNFFCFMGFSLSSILSKTIGRYSSLVFNVVCGVFCFIAALLVICFLPETKGEPLCETADDVAVRSKRLGNKCNISTKLYRWCAQYGE